MNVCLLSQSLYLIDVPLFLQTYINEHPQYEELQLKRNKELEAVLEPKEGEEVLLFEVLDKDTKTTTSKPKSRRRESQSEEVTACTVIFLSLVSLVANKNQGGLNNSTAILRRRRVNSFIPFLL